MPNRRMAGRMEPTVKLNLKPNRKLIDPNFDGYKLSLDSLPVYKLPVNDVDEVKISERQYSFQHMKNTSFHNHLHDDPWHLEHVYYINQEWEIILVQATQNFQLSQPEQVFKVPHKNRTKERFNVSLQFISADLAVIADGTGLLYILETGDRTTLQKWKEVYCSNQCTTSEEPFLLKHAVLVKSSTVDCLLLHIEENSDEETTTHSKTPFTIVLKWITITLEDDRWKLSKTRRICGQGSIDFAAIEPTGKGIYIISESRFKFTYDSSRSLCQENERSSEHSAQHGKPKYAWTQTNTEVTAWFQFADNILKADVDYKLTSSYFYLGLKNGINIVEGTLFSSVDLEGSTWTIEKNRLEVTLAKSNLGLIWSELVKGDISGEEIPNAEVIEEVKERMVQLTFDPLNPDVQGQQLGVSFNPQQLEECDAFPVDTFSLVRMDDELHEITHEVNLSSHQWLFSVTRTPEQIPVFCIRHDVDGLLWQLSPPDPDAKPDWQLCKHVTTFSALGYVQASKQEKKFMSCSPEGTFAVLCDMRRHVYLYFQPSVIGSDLRNRKTGQRVTSVAKQQLVTLDPSDVLGMHVSNSNLFVLTRETLFVITVMGG